MSRPQPCHNGRVRIPLPLTPRVTALMAGVMLLAAAAGMPRGATAAAPRALTPGGQGALVFIGDSLTVGADAFGALATNLRRPRT